MRTPTAATAAAFSTAPQTLSVAGQKELPAPASILLSGGSGASTQDRVTVDACAGLGSGGGRKEARRATAAEPAGGSSGRREEEEEEGSFPRFQQQLSRHTKFHDDDDDDEGDDEGDDERKQRKANDEPKKKKRRRLDKGGGEEEEEEETAAATPLPSSSLPPPPASSSSSSAPCRVDLSLTAATIAVALRSPQRSAAAGEEGKRNAAASLSRPAPRGNYDRYYGYRLAGLSASASSPQPSPAHEALYGPGAADPRLRSLLPYLGLFRGRALLDVGCNGGVLTLALAAAAGVSSAVGIDADAKLVRSARARCLRMRESAAGWERALRAGREAAEEAAAAGPSSDPSPAPPFLLPEPGGRSLAGKRAAARACSRALRATAFSHEDFVASAPLREGGDVEAQEPRELFGAALCLSVTKWVHLLHGDAGIERLFARLSRSLTKGAHLVLEPQPWRSYQRAVRKEGVREALQLCSSSPSAASSPSPQPRSLASLKIRPDDFVALLEAPRHGFVLVRSLGAPEGAAPGFDRPLLLFRKK